MPKSDSLNTTDPSGAPTPDEMYAMWLANVREQERLEVLERYESNRRAAALAIYGEAA